MRQHCMFRQDQAGHCNSGNTIVALAVVAPSCCLLLQKRQRPTRVRIYSSLWSPFKRPEALRQLTGPSWSRRRPRHNRSSRRNSRSFFMRTIDLGSSRAAISCSRCAFSYSLTWLSTCEMVCLISASACTSAACSSVPAVDNRAKCQWGQGPIDETLLGDTVQQAKQVTAWAPQAPRWWITAHTESTILFKMFICLNFCLGLQLTLESPLTL